MHCPAAEDDVFGLPFGAVVLRNLDHVLPVIRVCYRGCIFDFIKHATTDCYLVRLPVNQQSGTSHRIEGDEIAIESSAAVLKRFSRPKYEWKMWAVSQNLRSVQHLFLAVQLSG